jgi:chemotaxis protein methyltransferase CheR
MADIGDASGWRNRSSKADLPGREGGRSMTDAELVAFLQAVLPRLKLRWAGYRKVRGQVGKRIRRRLTELGLADLAAYRARLEDDPEEREVLRGFCAVTISRFYRNRAVWEALQHRVLPIAAEDALTAREKELRCWSIGCASGEEPYTLAVLWTLTLAHRYPALRLRILGTDVDERVLARARVAEYAAGTLRELPLAWRDQAFEQDDDVFRIRERFRAGVDLRREDVRVTLPDDEFRLILCRNLVCTYFDEELQRQTIERILSRLWPGGFLVLGSHERLPLGPTIEPWDLRLGIFRSGRGPRPARR